MALPSADQARPDRSNSTRFAVNSPSTSHSRESRTDLVTRLSQQLADGSTPRIHLLVIMAVAGGAAFLSSTMMLWSDRDAFQSMMLRYPAAALCGYVAFIGLIRFWISLHRSDEGAFYDVTPDVVEAAVRSSVPSVPRLPDEPLSLELESTRPRTEPSTVRTVRDSVLDAGSVGWDFDLGDFGWLVVAACAAVGGLIAIGYVVYIAPVLLAEVALDAAIISALYRKLRADETGYWLTTVLTRTWVPALVLVVFSLALGYALEQVAPDARSIGGVIRSFAG
jgi:hypothetical protein